MKESRIIHSNKVTAVNMAVNINHVSKNLNFVAGI
jgi:hypothetical protein